MGSIQDTSRRPKIWQQLHLPPRSSAHFFLIVGTIVGIAAGISLYDKSGNGELDQRTLFYMQQPSVLFINVLQILIIPIISSSIISAAGSMEYILCRKVILLGVFLFYGASQMNSILGLPFVLLIQPGKAEGLDQFVDFTPPQDDDTPFVLEDVYLDFVRSSFPRNIVEATMKTIKTKILDAENGSLCKLLFVPFSSHCVCIILSSWMLVRNFGVTIRAWKYVLASLIPPIHCIRHVAATTSISMLTVLHEQPKVSYYWGNNASPLAWLLNRFGAVTKVINLSIIVEIVSHLYQKELEGLPDYNAILKEGLIFKRLSILKTSITSGDRSEKPSELKEKLQQVADQPVKDVEEERQRMTLARIMSIIDEPAIAELKGLEKKHVRIQAKAKKKARMGPSYKISKRKVGVNPVGSKEKLTTKSVGH